PEVVGRAEEGADGEGALVEAVQWVFPGEADPSVHLDGPFAGEGGSLGGPDPGRGGGDGRLGRVLAHGPSRPVHQRASGLDLRERLGELVADGLERADGACELLPGAGVLEGELEGARPGPDGPGGERGQSAVAHPWEHA